MGRSPLSHPTAAVDQLSDKLSDGHRYYFLILLTLIQAFNFVDRQILSVLIEPIKLEFGLQDWVLGAMTGLAFSLFYAGLGIPIAMLSDRFNRRNIIAVCASLFSAMTIMCGLAANAWQLFLARIGVGIGEAGTMPAAQSILSDLFPPERRAAAMGLLATGGNIGLMLGLLIGGWVNVYLGWRAAFFVAALPGLILAALVFFTNREPRRQNPHEHNPNWLQDMVHSIADVARIGSVRRFIIGAALYGMAAYGIHTWMSSYFIRYHAMNTGDAGTVSAVIVGFLGAIGTYLGGLWCSMLVRRFGVEWNAYVPALAIGISMPLLIAMFMTDNTPLAIVLFIIPGFLSSVYAGPTWATIQQLVAPHRRAMAASLFFLLYNLIGLGLGPFAVGTMSDVLEGFVGNQSLRWAMSINISLGIFAVIIFLNASRYLKEDLAQAPGDKVV